MEAYLGSRPAPSHWPRLDRRVAWIVLAFGAAAAFIAYMTWTVPVHVVRPPNGVLLFCPLAAPPLPRGQIISHWPAAVFALVFVVLVVVTTVALALRRPAPAPVALTRGGGIPVPLRRHSVGAGTVRGALLVSSAGATAALARGGRLWVAGAAGVAPLVPVGAVEFRARLRRYGAFAFFALVAVLQVGHVGEHSVQVFQLLLTQGDLDRSHGVFGQLDFETVHFVWDSVIWMITIAMVLRYGRENPWMWVAFAAASLHEIEHLYLFWIYHADRSFYVNGGFEGIMGNGGLIGSPLARPYLHMAYNLLVTIPLVIACWDQSRRIEARQRAGGGLVTP